jgi:ankyrin repeat protein
MERGARADVLDFSHRSPLALAAGGGYADCVRLFLSDGSAKRMLDEPSSTACADTRGRTPLLIAAGRGHEAVRLIPG